MVSSTASVRRRTSIGGLERDQLAAPQSGLDQGLDHQPVLGGQRGRRSYSPGVRVRALAAITSGSSVWSQGLRPFSDCGLDGPARSFSFAGIPLTCL